MSRILIFSGSNIAREATEWPAGSYSQTENWTNQISTALPFNSSGRVIHMSPTYSTRNLVFGFMGLGTNFLAMIVLLTLKDIQRPIQISLLSLVFSDIVNMSSTVTSEIVVWSDMTQEPACLPIIYLLLISVDVTYCTIAQQSIFNYAAIFYPVKFRAWPKIKFAVIYAVSSWIYAIIINIGCVGFSLPPKYPCFPAIRVRGFRAFGTAFTIVTSSVLVIFLNVRIILKIRQRCRVIRDKSRALSLRTVVTPFHIKRKWNSTTDTPTCNSVQQHISVTLRTREVEGGADEFLSERSNNRTVVNSCETPMGVKHSDILLGHRTPASESLADADKSGCSTYSCDPHGGTGRENCEVTGSAVNRPDFSVLSSPGVTRKAEITKHLVEIRISQCGPKMRKISKTLTIFTLWCCFVNLPSSVYTIWLACLSKDRIVSAVQTPGGMFVSTINMIGSIVNPILYSCGLIQWGKLLNKLKTLPAQQ